MKLSKFIELSGMSASLVAKKIGAKSRMTVKRYVDGTRIPSEEYLNRIEALTKGLVTAKDFIAEAEDRKRTEHTLKIKHRLSVLKAKPKNAHEVSNSQESPSGMRGGWPHAPRAKNEKETHTPHETSTSKEQRQNRLFVESLLKGLEGADLESKEREVIEALREEGDFDDAWRTTSHLHRLNPLEEAMSTLGKRVVERAGNYVLDGRPASLQMIMTQANNIRKRSGLAPLSYPLITPLQR